MLSKKILHTTSTFAALGILLGSVCPSPVWAMEANKEGLFVDAIPCIARQISKQKVNAGDLGEQLITDWKSLGLYRLVSKSWRKVTDAVIREDNLFSLKLSPNNYTSDLLEHMASLTTTIYLVGWSQDNSRFIQDALSQENAERKKFLAHVSEIRCYESSIARPFNSYEIGDEGVVALGLALKNMTQLTSLSLCISMDEKGTQSLTQSLSSLSQLTQLSFGAVHGEEGGKALGAILPHLTALKSLRLYGSMGPLGTMYFTKKLSSLENLESLDLSDHGIGDIGAVALAKQLKHLTNLDNLQITKSFSLKAPEGQSCLIREAGEKYLQKKAKKHNPTLKISCF